MRLHAWNLFTTFALIEAFLKEKIYAWLEHHLSDFVFLLDRFKYVFIGFEVWLELFMYMYKISISVVKFTSTRGTNVWSHEVE